MATPEPAIGLTMFGVTTPCVQAVQARLEERFDCLIFHATGAGGQLLREARRLRPPRRRSRHHDDRDRRSPVRRRPVGGRGQARGLHPHGVPYVGSVGALDMVNFGPRESVPDALRRPQSLRPQPAGHADAHDAGGERGDRPLDRRAAQPHGGPRALPAAARRRLADRCAGQAVPRPAGRRRAVSTRSATRFEPGRTVA